MKYEYQVRIHNVSGYMYERHRACAGKSWTEWKRIDRSTCKRICDRECLIGTTQFV